LSGILQGNGPLSLFGTIGAYLGALVIIPLISWTLLNPAAFDPFKLILITLGLIILPLAFSRLLIREGWQGRIGPYRGTIVNWSFFIIFYTAIALNRDVLLGDARSLLPVALISFVSMFLLGFLIDWVCGLFHIPQDTRTSLVLLGTLKNQGLAGGLALTMFNPEAAIPATVAMVIMIGYILWLDFHKQRA
jgi:bile acid:Na+ symporter, BASS family